MGRPLYFFMFRIQLRPAMLKIALAAMWVALVLLIVLQFRWSNELGQAYEQRLKSSLASSAGNFRAAFLSDMAVLCRALQDSAPSNPPVLPLSPVPYRLYFTDSTLKPLKLFDPASNLLNPVDWPKNWLSLREELLSNAEDLASASPRRWFNRPWLSSDTVPVLFRAMSLPGSLDEFPDGIRFQGFLVLALDLPVLSAQYFRQANDRTFAASVIGARTVVKFRDTLIFDSHPGTLSKESSSLNLDLLSTADSALTSRFNIRPTGETSPWRLRAEHRPGSLDQAVSALRMRNLATGLAVSFVLLAAIVFLIYNARRAEQLAKQQTDFVAGFSHELRTPITAICMLAGNLRDGLTENPEQVRQYGGLLLEQGARLRNRIEDILGFAAGRSQSLHLQPVDVPELVARVLQEESPLLKNFHIDTRYDPDLPLAHADPAALRSCMANLVSNAAKYARASAWLGVEVTDGPNGTLSITVADRGPGIAEADQARIFEPFFRGKEARSGNVPGSGLGLHLVRTRIESMGGKITLHSVPGKGTALTILLRSTSE